MSPRRLDQTLAELKAIAEGTRSIPLENEEAMAAFDQIASGKRAVDLPSARTDEALRKVILARIDEVLSASLRGLR